MSGGGEYYSTRSVLAGARKSKAPLLTHTIITTETRGSFVACKRVKLDNLADRHSTDSDAPVTCAACNRVIDRSAGAR